MTSSEEALDAEEFVKTNELSDINQAKVKKTSSKIKRKAKITEKIRKRRERRAIVNKREPTEMNCQEALDASLPKYNWLEEKIQRQHGIEHPVVTTLHDNACIKKSTRGRKSQSTKLKKEKGVRKRPGRRSKKTVECDLDKETTELPFIYSIPSDDSEQHCPSPVVLILDDSPEINLKETSSPSNHSISSTIQTEQTIVSVSSHVELPDNTPQAQLRLPLKKRHIIKVFQDAETYSSFDKSDVTDSPVEVKRNRIDEDSFSFTSRSDTARSPSCHATFPEIVTASMSQTSESNQRNSFCSERSNTSATYSVLSLLSSSCHSNSSSESPHFHLTTDNLTEEGHFLPTPSSYSSSTQTKGEQNSLEDVSSQISSSFHSNVSPVSSAFPNSYLSPSVSAYLNTRSVNTPSVLSSPSSNLLDGESNSVPSFPTLLRDNEWSSDSSSHLQLFSHLARFLPQPLDFSTDKPTDSFIRTHSSTAPPSVQKMQPLRPIAIRCAPSKTLSGQEVKETFDDRKEKVAAFPKANRSLWNGSPTTTTSSSHSRVSQPNPVNISAFSQLFSPFQAFMRGPRPFS